MCLSVYKVEILLLKGSPSQSEHSLRLTNQSEHGIISAVAEISCSISLSLCSLLLTAKEAVEQAIRLICLFVCLSVYKVEIYLLKVHQPIRAHFESY